MTLNNGLCLLFYSNLSFITHITVIIKSVNIHHFIIMKI